MLRAFVSPVLVVNLGPAARPQHNHLTAKGVSSETPSWSPDGRRLVISAGPALHHQVYVIDVDGRHARRLTSGEQNRWPAWSPDGKSIVFMSDRDGQGELYVMNADGSSQRRLTRTPVHEYAPAWSPKGDAIAYLTEMPGGKQAADGHASGRQPRARAGRRSPRVREAKSAGLDRVYALTIVAADGSGRRTLTRTDALPGQR